MADKCSHPPEWRESYHNDDSVVCNACNCVIEQYGKPLKEPSFLGAVKFPDKTEPLFTRAQIVAEINASKEVFLSTNSNPCPTDEQVLDLLGKEGENNA